MSRRVRVKPGKGQSTVGFFAGIVFCFIGLFVVIPLVGPFGILWTIFAVIITVSNGYNAFSDKGIASHEITIEDDFNQGFNQNFNQENMVNRKTSEERLKELQTLYEKGVITEDEYQKKRKQILDEI